MTLGLSVTPAWATTPDQEAIGADTLAGAPVPAQVALIDTSVYVTSRTGVQVTQVGAAGVNPDAHGSLMAMAIAGARGAAPGTPVRAYNCDAAGYVDLTCAREALADADARGIKVALLAWSSGADSPGPATSLREDFAQTAATARAHGMLIVAAAGVGGTAFPAHLESVLSAGAADMSGRALYPDAPADLLAPGEAVAALNGAGMPMAGSGSSYAAAFTAGIAARLMTLAPGRDVAEYERALIGEGSLNATHAAQTLGVASPARTTRPRAKGIYVRAGARGVVLGARARTPGSALVADVRGMHLECARTRCVFAVAGRLPARVRVQVERGMLSRAYWVRTGASAR